MSSKQDLEISVKALAAYDADDYATALQLFEQVAPNSKTLFNMARLFADVGQHAEAIALFEEAVAKDGYMAVSFFQCGVAHFQLGETQHAMRCFNEALFHLRGNTHIDYAQLGLAFKLYACEVLFNRGLCYLRLDRPTEGLQDLSFAAREKQTQAHDMIDEAIRYQGNGYTVFSVPQGMLYRPLEQKVRNLAVRNYLGKARLVAATDDSDQYTGFRAFEERQVRQRKDEPVLQGYAAANLVRHSLREGSIASTSSGSQPNTSSRSGSVRSGSASSMSSHSDSPSYDRPRVHLIERPLPQEQQTRHLATRSQSDAGPRPPRVPEKDLALGLRKGSAPALGSTRSLAPPRPPRPGLPGSSVPSRSRQASDEYHTSGPHSTSETHRSHRSRQASESIHAHSRSALDRKLPPTPPPELASRPASHDETASTVSSNASVGSRARLLRPPAAPVRLERGRDPADPTRLSNPKSGPVSPAEQYLALVSDYADGPDCSSGSRAGSLYFPQSYSLGRQAEVTSSPKSLSPRKSPGSVTPRAGPIQQLTGLTTGSATPVQMRIVHALDDADDADAGVRILRMTLGQILALPLNKLMDKVEAKTHLQVKKLCVREGSGQERGDLVLLCDEEDLQLAVEEALQRMQTRGEAVARLTLYAK